MLQVGNNNFTSWFVHINYIHHLTLKWDWMISIAISETPQYPSIFWKSWRCQWRLSRARLHEVWSSPRTEQRFSRCLAEGALWRTSQPEEKTLSHKRAGNKGRPRQLHLLWGIAHCRTWPGGRGGNRKRTWEEKKCEARSYTSQDNHHLPFSSWKFSLKNCQEMSRPARFLAILPIRWTESWLRTHDPMLKFRACDSNVLSEKAARPDLSNQSKRDNKCFTWQSSPSPHESLPARGVWALLDSLQPVPLMLRSCRLPTWKEHWEFYFLLEHASTYCNFYIPKNA